MPIERFLSMLRFENEGRLDDSVSAFGVGAFQYDVQQLLGITIDVIPTFAFRRIEDQAFVQSVQSEAVAV